MIDEPQEPNNKDVSSVLTQDNQQVEIGEETLTPKQVPIEKTIDGQVLEILEQTDSLSNYLLPQSEQEDLSNPIEEELTKSIEETKSIKLLVQSDNNQQPIDHADLSTLKRLIELFLSKTREGTFIGDHIIFTTFGSMVGFIGLFSLFERNNLSESSFYHLTSNAAIYTALPIGTASIYLVMEDLYNSLKHVKNVSELNELDVVSIIAKCHACLCILLLLIDDIALHKKTIHKTRVRKFGLINNLDLIKTSFFVLNAFGILFNLEYGKSNTIEMIVENGLKIISSVGMMILGIRSFGYYVNEPFLYNILSEIYYCFSFIVGVASMLAGFGFLTMDTRSFFEICPGIDVSLSEDHPLLAGTFQTMVSSIITLFGIESIQKHLGMEERTAQSVVNFISSTNFGGFMISLGLIHFGLRAVRFSYPDLPLNSLEGSNVFSEIKSTIIHSIGLLSMSGGITIFGNIFDVQPFKSVLESSTSMIGAILSTCSGISILKHELKELAQYWDQTQVVKLPSFKHLVFTLVGSLITMRGTSIFLEKISSKRISQYFHKVGYTLLVSSSFFLFGFKLCYEHWSINVEALSLHASLDPIFKLSAYGFGTALLCSSGIRILSDAIDTNSISPITPSRSLLDRVKINTKYSLKKVHSETCKVIGYVSSLAIKDVIKPVLYHSYSHPIQTLVGLSVVGLTFSYVNSLQLRQQELHSQIQHMTKLDLFKKV